MNVTYHLPRAVCRASCICLLAVVWSPQARGQVTFFNPPTYVVSGTAYPSIVADFNRDGIPDLLAPAADGGYLQLGKGNGTAATASGTYTITVTGTAGSLVNSAVVTFIVQ